MYGNEKKWSCVEDKQMGKREEAAEGMSEKNMGGYSEFRDPYEGKISASGHSPRVHTKKSNTARGELQLVQ